MYLENFKQLKLDFSILSKSSNSKEYRDYVNSFLTRDLLIELTDKYSANQICNEIFKPIGYKIAPASFIRRCNKLGINTLTIKEQSNRRETREKYKNTCLKKYGSENVLSKDTISYHKRNKTVKRKYGVSNVFQLKENIEKSRKTMLEKYGVTCSSQLPWYERNFGRTSKIHLQIEEYLKSQEIIFESEKLGFLKFNKALNRLFSPKVDILIESKKIIIEVNGDRWHANPKFFKKDDLIKTWEGNVTAEHIWNYDNMRLTHLESFGYKVIVLWEDDIKKNFGKIKKILDKLK